MYGTADKLLTTIGFQATAMQGTMEDDDWGDVLETVLTDISAVIDGMISSRYDVSDYADNAVLERIALSVGRYDMYCQYVRNDVPETIRKDKEEAFKMLNDIQSGKLALTPDTPDEDAPAPVESEFTSSAQVFSQVLL
ncbi:MAG: DUF1320 family protein [Candidatus Cloacimonetes bacterium]|nr:DUF1320 family protein [Candidatus Cloacimonadota bacterium]